MQIKFIYSEKATKFCEISSVDLTVTIEHRTLPIQNVQQNFQKFLKEKKKSKTIALPKAKIVIKDQKISIIKLREHPNSNASLERFKKN